MSKTSSQQTVMPTPNDPTEAAFHRIAHEQVKYAEQKNPTMGKYRSFSRQLDEFQPVSQKFNEPSLKSYRRQDNYHSNPHTNSTHVLADAHFAKALRMLSSPFDRLENGGNALPEKVYGGGYRQEYRGEKFVRMNWLKKGKRRKRRSSASGDVADGENNRERRKLSSWKELRDLPNWCLEAMDMLQDWYDDAKINLYEILGMEMEDDEAGTQHVEETDVMADKQSRNEEDVFSWSDTRVGSQLIRAYDKVVSLWTRHPRSEYDSSRGSSSTEDSSSTKELMSQEDHIAIEGLYHLEKAAELGHAEAQRMVANSLATGILPLSDHSLIQRYAKWQHLNSNHATNLTALLSNAMLEVPDDFSSGGEQLSRAIVLWHLSAMDGNVESAMALGFRHLYSATRGTTRLATDSLEEHVIAPGYSPVNGGSTDSHGTVSTSHYGVLGTCPTALAYYEAVANGVMDELESGPTKGKVSPPLDEHRLAQIHMRGGASVALERHNLPDEIEEALQYYRCEIVCRIIALFTLWSEISHSFCCASGCWHLETILPSLT
jgi:hypothetical protein